MVIQFPLFVSSRLPCEQLIWFLLRQTREKPLRATLYFSIEHARVRHAVRGAFDVNFICQ